MIYIFSIAGGTPTGGTIALDSVNVVVSQSGSSANVSFEITNVKQSYCNESGLAYSAGVINLDT